MKVAFVRHGHAESNVFSPDKRVGDSEAALTEQGEEQLMATGNIIGELLTVRVVYCSPLLRTRQSAHVLASFVDAEVKVDERLKEIDKGEWHGERVGKVMEYEAEIEEHERHRFRPPGGENWRDVGNRMSSFVNEKALEAEATGTDLLIVSHDHPIRMGVGHLLDRPVTTWEDLMVEHASITLLRKDENGWQFDEVS